MPLDYYKKVLSGNILVAHRMVKEGAKGVLKAKLSNTNTRSRIHTTLIHTNNTC